MLVDFIQSIHTATKRDYLARMTKDKPRCMEVARKFDKNFWDGDRKYGYGGYINDGRWRSVAKKLIDKYKINEYSSVLDIGCGKGYLAQEISYLTDCYVDVCDISDYALDNCEIVTKHKCDIGKDKIKKHYNLIISINTLHNLILPELKNAIKEISNHTNDAYIVVESYRNEKELCNLQSWALTAECFFRPEEWQFLFKEWEYNFDYEFIFFE